jgi:hypothetical protein
MTNGAGHIGSNPEGTLSGKGSGVQPWTAFGPIDTTDPLNDGRVIWLIAETCNRQALQHRYEDIRRRESGGKWDGAGYPFVHVDEKAMETLRGHYDPADDLGDDSRAAWQGFILLIGRQFGPDDDVSALVHALANDAEAQESFGTQWPVAQIVRFLNGRQPAQAWTDDRVENAKRRLARFVTRLKQTHGLDPVDLRALLVRIAREIRPGVSDTAPAARLR